MQIHVLGAASSFSTQVKAYAEYKVFSRLAPHARRIGVVTVVLTSGNRAQEPACCAVTADLGAAGSVMTRVRRRQPVEAIDTAAAAVSDAVTRRLAARSPGAHSRTEKGVRNGP